MIIDSGVILFKINDVNAMPMLIYSEINQKTSKRVFRLPQRLYMISF